MPCDGERRSMADGDRLVDIPFRIVMLGHFQVVTRGGAAIPFGRTRPGILLASLALRPDGARERGQFIELLWPGDGAAPEMLRARLRETQWELRTLVLPRGVALDTFLLTNRQ